MTLRDFRGLILLLPLIGCTPKESPAPTPTNQPPSPPIPTTTGSGLSATDRQRFYHLAEGSETFPLDWLRALESVQTGKPFLDNLERFGLIPDPSNPDGLPVGLTAEATHDSRFLGTRMVGVNCAGCHVGELTYQGKSYRIDGGPNLFDLTGFYKDIIESATGTATRPDKLFAFLRRLDKEPEKSTLLAAVRPGPKGIIKAFADLDAMRRSGELEKGVAEQIDAVVKEEKERPTVDLAKGLKVATASAPDKPQAEAHKGLVSTRGHDDAKPLQSKSLGESSPLADVGTESELKSALIPQTFDEIRLVIRLLNARVKLLGALVKRQAGTEPGSGRVDAFGNARNMVFADDPIPTTSPVSYPHLWGFGKLKWLHWDANTNSVMERNIGQALGLGAVLIDPDSGESTILPRNLHELEMLARKITPPPWPDAFGKIDPAKAERGATLFQNKCASCHTINSGAADDPIPALDKIGTDPARALNFAKPLHGKPFSDGIGGLTGKVKEKAYETFHVSKAEALEMEAGRDPVVWRTTGGYPNRPMTAIWATAPYLHNNSVPTLYDLLQPAAKRPKTFPVGHRDYDPVKLGYTTKASGERDFTFDTSIEGNHNTGHEFGAELSEPERMDLLEYLKKN